MYRSDTPRRTGGSQEEVAVASCEIWAEIQHS